MNPIWFVSFCCRSEANKYTSEELMLMKTQDMGYILQKLQSEKKVDWCFYCKTHGWLIAFLQSFLEGFGYGIPWFNAENWEAGGRVALCW